MTPTRSTRTCHRLGRWTAITAQKAETKGPAPCFSSSTAPEPPTDPGPSGRKTPRSTRPFGTASPRPWSATARSSASLIRFRARAAFAAPTVPARRVPRPRFATCAADLRHSGGSVRRALEVYRANILESTFSVNRRVDDTHLAR